ncbi:hypothetical protein BDZ94DRAFT_1306724 [Collybia nuda]|uniref:Uncharacterized protein n=1 Tax=Collybia nuda TaxID=64659 RepID=A0A9P5YB30_9AGAR|nr:hypothetical protein BDZ94DRAFT_1306724 [Collybia nuda]
MASRVWLITGTSSGFGKRLVHLVLSRGDRVIATARSENNLNELLKECDAGARDNLRTLQLDLTEGEASLKKKADEAAAFWGQIDVLVNNAGIGYPGLLEEAGSTLLRKQYETNVFGLMDMTTAVLPHLRARKEATMVVVGSRSAYRTEIPGLGPYALTETLAAELAPLNIRVLLVAPGSFRTEGIYGQQFFIDNNIADYNPLRELSGKRFRSIAGTQKGDPKKAMEVVVDIVRGEGVAKGKTWPGLLVLGGDAEADVRAKCTKTLEVLDEWKEVICNVNFD